MLYYYYYYYYLNIVNINHYYCFFFQVSFFAIRRTPFFPEEKTSHRGMRLKKLGFTVETNAMEVLSASVSRCFFFGTLVVVGSLVFLLPLCLCIYDMSFLVRS